MNTLKIYPDKRLQFVEENSIYITENKIQSFNIILPLTFGDYRTNELECEMRVYLSDDEYMSYEVSTASGKGEVPITNDITENVQTVKIIFFFTKDGNVIGKTNAVEKKIEDAPYLGDPLTPRAEFDEVISEQRQTIQEQGETITQQGETITQQGEQITELNGEVTELTNENGELRTQHTADQNTIQYLIDNPPEAHLQTKSVTPTNQMQVVEPDEGYQGLSTVTVGAVTPPRLQSKQVAPSMSTSYVTADNGYDGLSSVTVDKVDASIDSDIQPQNIKEGVEILGVEGTFNPFPYNSVGGIYILSKNEDDIPEDYFILNWDNSGLNFVLPINQNIYKAALKKVVFKNCKNITSLQYTFANCTSLKEVALPDSFRSLPQLLFQNCYSLNKVVLGNQTNTIPDWCFDHCGELREINMPSSLVTVGQYWCVSPKLEIVTLGENFNCSLNLSSSTLYSHDTILSWFNALADRTGQTAYTLTIGATNLNKMTAEEKAIATNKNWNLA